MTPWTAARQAPLSMGFPRHEYWSGLQIPSPGDLPDPGIEPASLMSSALAGGFLLILLLFIETFDAYEALKISLGDGDFFFFSVGSSGQSLIRHQSHRVTNFFSELQFPHP